MTYRTCLSRGMSLRIAALSAMTIFLGCDSSNPSEPSSANLEVMTARAVSDLGAPTGANATIASDSSIEVSWLDNASTESGFEVHRSTTGDAGVFSLLTKTKPGATREIDDDLVGTGTHCYKVRAIKVAGKKITYSAFSNIACIRPPLPPLSPPSNLTALAAPNTFIVISWQDNTNDETRIHLTRSVGQTINFYEIGMLPANSVTYTDEPFYPGELYCYQARAIRETKYADGSSSFTYSVVSNTACVIAPPPLPPAPASAARATASSSTTMSVAWTDNAYNETGFRIYRSTDGGVSWLLAGSRPRADFGDPWTTVFEDSGLQSERQACYKVVAFNSGGEAAPSNTVCNIPPLGPTGFTAARVGAEQILFSWNDASSLEDGYEVWVSWAFGDCGGSSGMYEGESLLALLPAGATSFLYTETVIGCAPGEGVTGYFVVAKKSGGRSTAAFATPP